jgi:hypothetical protein
MHGYGLKTEFETPVQREVVPRQELAIKLVFAMRSGMPGQPDPARLALRYQ